MKKVLTILFVLSVNTISLAQVNQQSEPMREASVTQQRIVDLPLTKRNFRPKLTLQRAVVVQAREVQYTPAHGY